MINSKLLIFYLIIGIIVDQNNILCQLLTDDDLLLLSQPGNQINTGSVDRTKSESIKSQSDQLCSVEDHRSKIQCFQEVPKREYVVFEGDDVSMNCRVAYQKGKLQWAFNGQMLGFNRDIPTHPRLRMPGNPNIGDHKLFLENAKVEDSGNYECQLGPSLNQPYRRSFCKLLVLKMPSRPIIHQQKRGEVYNVSVTSKNDQQNTKATVTLSCISQYGNPPSTFKWLINNQTITSQSTYTARNGFEIKIADIKSINITSSSITIDTDYLKNDDFITCRVFNMASMKQKIESHRKLNTHVRVIKRDLPGPLRFSSQTSSVREGSQFRLTCTCLQPGHPPVELYWRLENNTKLKLSPNWITDSGSPKTTLIISRITRAWHNVSISCYGLQKGFRVDNVITKLILVKFKPSQLSITAFSKITNRSIPNPTSVFTNPIQPIAFKCFTSPYYSNSITINWFLKTSITNKWKEYQSSITKSHKTKEGLKITTSYLEFVPSNIDADASNKMMNERLQVQVTCTVKQHTNLGRQVTIEAYEVPSPPIITINGESKSPLLTLGEEVVIQCAVEGGRPPPELYLLNDREEEVKDAQKINQIAIKKLIYKYRATYDTMNSGYRCLLKTEGVLNTVSLSTDIINIRVALAPRNVKLKVSIPDTGGLVADHTTIAHCTTDSSYPPAKIEWWWHYHCSLSGATFLQPTDTGTLKSTLSSLQIRQKCRTVVLQDNIKTSYNPTTKSTTSSLFLKLNYTHDQSFIECVVPPHLKWSNFHGALTQFEMLHVQYKPQIVEPPFKLTPLNFIVLENHPFNLKLRLKSNPSPEGYTWLFNSLPVSDNIETDLDKFILDRATPEMMGNYSLMVENKIGRNTFQFFLNVTFPPKLLGEPKEIKRLSPSHSTTADSSSLSTSSSNKALLTCSVKANPSQERSFVRWSRINKPGIDFIQDHTILLANLLHSNKQTETTTVLREAPTWSSPTVNCNGDQWTKSSVSVNCISLASTEIVSSLQIVNLNPFIIGTYVCHFSNSIAIDTASKYITLLYPTKPIPIKNNRYKMTSAAIATQAELSCYFLSYPDPDIIWWSRSNWNFTVTWRQTVNNADSSNQLLSNTHQGYYADMKQPDHGYIKVILKIMVQSDNDYGQYSCHAQNKFGKGHYKVTLLKPGPPVQPQNITLINVTDSSISMAWIIGFNGGSNQIIRIRWKPRYSEQVNYNSKEVPETFESDLQYFTLHGLKPDTDYELDIFSYNRYTSSPGTSFRIFIKTLTEGSKSQNILPGSMTNQNGDDDNESNMKPNKISKKSDTNKLLIIVLLVLVGCLLFSVKISLIAFCIRRKNKKLKKSKESLPSPTTQHIMDGYMHNTDSMEMRAPSLVRSGMDSTNGILAGPGAMYPPSVSDRMSHNGSDNGLKLNYYKTSGSDEHYPLTSSAYPTGASGPGGPELDLVASALRRSHHYDQQPPPNFPMSVGPPTHYYAGSPTQATPGILADNPYLLPGYYTTHRMPSNHHNSPGYYPQQHPQHMMMLHRKSSVSSTDTPPGSGQSHQLPGPTPVIMTPQHLPQPPVNILPQYTPVSMYSSAGSHPNRQPHSGTASNASQSPPPPITNQQQSNQPINRKYSSTGYSPLIGQSGAPSTVEEYLSSANSAGSDNARYGHDEYYANPLLSFKMNQHRNIGNQENQINGNETSALLQHRQQSMRYNDGMLIEVHYPNMDDRLQMSMTSDTDQLVKPPHGFSTEPLNESKSPPLSNKTTTEQPTSPAIKKSQNGNLTHTNTNSADQQPTNTNNSSTDENSNKLGYVDLINHHSSPSVIKFNGNSSAVSIVSEDV